MVVPKPDKVFCEELLTRSPDLLKTCHVISGGDSRQESVYQGLLAVEKAGLAGGIVVIHDGVRPFVKPEQIQSCIVIAGTTGACILAVPAQDTLKQVEKESTVISGTLPRDTIWFAQTPQAFRYEIIRTAHERALRDRISGTDDAMLVERMGIPVRMIPGSRQNIKITTPEDLALAEAILVLETSD
jgi:2-C-methyl-D-erythritol 4-phosphate cytidylyltransferase